MNDKTGKIQVRNRGHISVELILATIVIIGIIIFLVKVFSSFYENDVMSFRLREGQIQTVETDKKDKPSDENNDTKKVQQ